MAWPVLRPQHVVSCFQDNEANMLRMEDERQVIQSSLQKSANEVTQQLAQTTAKNTDLENNKQVKLITWDVYRYPGEMAACLNYNSWPNIGRDKLHPPCHVVTVFNILDICIFGEFMYFPKW